MDTKQAAALAMIQRRFAGAEAAVQRAFETSESFRGLCGDYLACLGALGRWQQSGSEDAHLRAAEYSALLAELENEIEGRLRHGPVPSRASRSEP